MFSGFQTTTIEVGETTIFIRRKGSGRPVLLLHGFPETHVMWHRVAPALAESGFSVVCADLRGYGASGKPETRPDHSPYAKSAMARDMVQLMEALGYPRFLVAGHDRGGRVAYRMALEYPQRVERVALFDVIPTSEVFERADARFAMGFWPWSLLAQPAPLPERLILGDPAAIVDHALSEWGSDPASFPPYVREAYVEALRDPSSVHAICEEYRAAASCDLERERSDRSEGRRIQCPTLVLWSKASPLEDWYEEAYGPVGIWKRWANEVSGRAIAGGHFFPEQNAAETLMELRAFFR